jgi:Protein of unknown function (DUF3352)
MRMKIPAAVLAAGVAAAVIVTAGGARNAGDPSLGGAAAVVPADAVAFAAIDTDATSAQSQAASGLLAKFPSLVTQLQQQFEQKTGLNWANDVAPALGSELDLALLPGPKPELVGLTQPADPSKLAALVAKAGHGLVSRTVGGWTAIAASASALDALTNATATLARDDTYVEATSHLAADALVRAYANGAEAQQLLASLRGTAPAAPAKLVWASAGVVAGSDGLELETFARTSEPAAAAYAAQLPDEIPSGVLAVVDFQAAGAAAVPPASSKLPQALQQLLAKVGPALGGETALYVTAGLPPAVTLVTHPADPRAAYAAIDGAIASLAGGGGIFSVIKPPLPYAVVDGALVVSTSTAGIQAYGAAGPKLSADPAFEEAEQASGLAPGRTTGFAYADIGDALPLVQALGPVAGITVPSGLGALRTLTAFGGASGDLATGTVFLEIK